ncbi:uncharacterized protein LOC21406945 [Morus notabilis]|uniref:uncharacterized protein LOC21406945 n=1 Tax=Morus notabilis TaxID=981085 RepID=UPI000CED2E0B|nr:uncharacterized protein LOC21406945 [Morus notabilis]
MFCIFGLQPLRKLVPVIGQRAVLGLSGYVINNIAFVFAAVYFYQYSESLYALFSIGGLYHLISGRNNIVILWFALSGFARYNGVINAGYICFQTMHRTYNVVLRKSTFPPPSEFSFSASAILQPRFFSLLAGRALPFFSPDSFSPVSFSPNLRRWGSSGFLRSSRSRLSLFSPRYGSSH